MTKEVSKYESDPYFLTEEEAYAFCEDTGKLARGIKNGLMLLAQRLYKIERQKLYKPTYEKFYLYCDEIELHESIASRLIGIYEKFVLDLQIPFEVIEAVEYTKLYEIRKVADTKEIAMHWIEQVNSPNPEQRLSIRDLKAKIKALQKLGDEDEQCPSNHGNTYLVRCCRDCGETWEEFGENTPEHTHEEN